MDGVILHDFEGEKASAERDKSEHHQGDRVNKQRFARQEMARAVPDRMVREIALRDARAPTGPSSQGAIPSSQQVSNVRGTNVAGSGTGWAHSVPLTADDRDRKSLAERCAPYGKDDVV